MNLKIQRKKTNKLWKYYGKTKYFPKGCRRRRGERLGLKLKNEKMLKVKNK